MIGPKDWKELKLEFQLKILTHNMESFIYIPLHILNLTLFRFNLSMIKSAFLASLILIHEQNGDNARPLTFRMFCNVITSSLFV